MTYTNVLDKKFEEQFDGVVAVIYELEARRGSVSANKKQIKIQ